MRQSQYQWIAAKERVTRTSRATERAARDAYLGVISDMARVEALRQALESSQTSLKATEAGYEVGTRTSVDVLDSATPARAGADDATRRAATTTCSTVISLRQAAGNLDKATLDELNRLLHGNGAHGAHRARTRPVPTPVPQPQN